MNIQQVVRDAGLTPENSIVIGSGILQALELRLSNDVEVIVSEDLYANLSTSPLFQEKLAHNSRFLCRDTLTIGFLWTIAGTPWTFQDLLAYSIIIQETRYITVEFLCNAKTNWLLNGEFRQKDKDDIILMNAYLEKQKPAHCCCG